MTAEELYEKKFGNADTIHKESVIRLLRNFAKAIKLEREQALRIHDVVGQSDQLPQPDCHFYDEESGRWMWAYSKELIDSLRQLPTNSKY